MKTALLTICLVGILIAKDSFAQHSEEAVSRIADQHSLTGQEARKSLTDIMTFYFSKFSEETRPDRDRERILSNNRDFADKNQRHALLVDQNNSNEARITQVGHSNFAGIFQVGEGNIAGIHQVGYNNFGKVFQHGIGNEAFMEIAGNKNRINVDQVGNYNMFNLDLEGDENYLNLKQLGEYNTYERLESGHGILSEDILQIGYGNTLNQSGVLSGGRSAHIIQEGNAMEVTVRHGY